ncbi:MAG: LacI family transcriptional regulator [Actinomycetales bacterium]|nr:LacI family transcriptional regulator [Actinomycetales bacterium]
MARRRPTVQDVADHAGVSVATVSFAFQKPHRVRAVTRQRVLAAAEALGYVPSANARGLRTGRTGAIGLYAYDYLIENAAEQTTGPRPTTRDDDLRYFPLYVDEVQRGVELECRRRGLVLMLGAGGSHGQLPAVIDVAGRVDGLVAFVGTAPREAIAQVSQRIPVVELGSGTRWGGARTIGVDNRGGTRQLVEHLLSTHGLRHLHYLGDPTVAEFAARYEGFRDALTAAGITAAEPAPSTPAYPAVTAATVHRLLACEDPPQALVCATDQEALVAIDTLHTAGTHVPDQIAVTGFDGILAGRLTTPRLTSIAQPMEEIGRTAVRLLTEAINDQVPPDPHDEYLPLTLQTGTSCGCPPTTS